MFRVVLLDDESITGGLAQSVLWEKHGCTVVDAASNGENGVTLIRKIQPDIVITDILMPGLNGLEMIAALREDFPQMQIAILTGCREFDCVRQAMRLGVVRYMLKPLNLDEMEEALAHMTERLFEYRQLFAFVPARKDKKEPDAAEVDSFVVRNAIGYLHRNYSGKITLQNVADHVYVSQWHLSKLLKKHTGENFVDILQQIRIEKAKELLKDPSLRINDVANMVGFSDTTHFSKTFKKITGSAAGKYRDKGV